MATVIDEVVKSLTSGNADVSVLLSKRTEMYKHVATAAELANRATNWTGNRESHGMFLYLIGDTRRALHILSAQAQSAAGKVCLGLAALDLNLPQKALDAVKGQKGDLAAHIAARAHLLAGDWDKAEAAIKGLGDSLDTQLLKIEYDFRAGKLDTAQSAIDVFLAKHPDNRSGLFLGALIADRCGDELVAISRYERICQQRPVNVDALLNLGVAYEDIGDFKGSVRCYRAVLAEHPNHGRARLFLKDAEASVDMFYDEDRERREDKRLQVLRTPVTDFELSVRSRNCLQKMKIETLGDLIAKTETELLQYKNFGETSLMEIKAILGSRGLRLGMAREEALKASSIDEALERAKPKHEGIMAESVDALELSVRARKCMDRMAIRTIGELCDHTEQTLLGAPNFGATSLIEVKRKLAELGLALKG